MAFDIKTAIGSYAPTLAKMLLGPLAGGAVGAIVSAMGLTPTGDQKKDTDAVTTMLQSGQLSPEQISAMRAADQKHAEIISQQGVDLTKINADHAQAMAAIKQQENSLVVDDVKDARSHNANTKEMWYTAWFVLISFAIIMVAVLVGCYYLLTTTVKIDSNLAIAIAGLVGSVVGYVAANAQTVINFVFGGSIGSRNNAKSLSDMTQQSLQQLAQANTSVVTPVTEEDKDK